MLAAGTLLQDRYLVIRQLSKGGMGAVYLVRHQRLGKEFALKETFFSDDELLRRAFEREARLLANLDHPALPKVTDHFSEGESQFLLMEYVPGEDLGAQLQRDGAAFGPDEVLDWADQLLDALEYLHAHDPPIIHRDIKPSNLKLMRRGSIVLLDFGLAKGAAAGMTHVSRSVFGFTPGYAPLEQVHGEGTDARSDLYSLAATLYHLLTGEAPPKVTTRVAAVADGRHDPLRPASEKNPRVPPAVAAVLTQALSRNREGRPPSAAAMREALRAARRATQAAPAPKHNPQDAATLLATQAASSPQPSQLTAQSPKAWRPSPASATSGRAPTPREVSAGGVRPQAPAGETAKPVGGRRLPVVVASVLIVGLILSLGLSLFIAGNLPKDGRPESPGTAGPPSLSAYQFATVKVNPSGKVTERRDGQARSFVEDLGNGVGLEMVEIPAGTFAMGSSPPYVQQALSNERRYDPNAKLEWFTIEAPQHQVTVPKFYMGKVEVTQGQYHVVAVLPSIDSVLPNPGYFDANHPDAFDRNLPVQGVDWEDAVEFCKRLSAKTGRKYRLPSEAEWEYAARAGTTTPFAFGETVTTDLVNYNGIWPYAGAPVRAAAGGAAAVGARGIANGFGLFDMHGNVWEWCSDNWHETYDGAPSDGSSWAGGDSSLRVLRGGSWQTRAGYCRSATRDKNAPSTRNNIIGFRVVAEAGAR